MPGPLAIGDSLVEITGDDAPCVVEFESVVRLQGSVDGTLPQLPVVSGPGGSWVSATYNPGEFAFWNTDGSLNRVVQAGTGDGPGEFRRVTDLLVDTAASRIHVLSGNNRIVTYSLDGEPLSTRTLSVRLLMGRLTDAGDILAASSSRMGVPRALLVSDDTVRPLGSEMRQPMASIAQVAAGASWTAEPPWYELEAHSLETGNHLATYRRVASWIPRAGDNAEQSQPGPLMMGVAFSPNQDRIFTRISAVVDLNAPGGEPQVEGATREEASAEMARYYDGVVEVISLSGDLIASTRFDNGCEVPWPLGGGAPNNYWYRIYDDLARSIEIFEPRLVPAR